MKLRRKCFSLTWKIKNSHVGIGKFLRGYWFWGCISLRAVRMLSAGGAERGTSSLAFWSCGCRALRRYCAG